MSLNLKDILTAFMVLFAVIDITGSIPIILDIKKKTGEIESLKATLVAFGIMIVFLFVGEPLLHLFGVDISSFAIAGSLVIFLIGLEMVLGVDLLKYHTPKGSSVVPLAFPLIAGAGTITTILSIKSQYSINVILIALTLNMIIVYLVLKSTRFFERFLGEGGIQILKKAFGIILLAIAIKLFITNTGINIPGGS